MYENLLITNTYDEFGRILSKTYANGGTVEYTYDNLDRVVETRYGGDNAKTLRCYYNSRGQLTYVLDTVGMYRMHYVYDMAGRVVRTERVDYVDDLVSFGTESWTSYSYENKGNRIESETYQTYGGTQTNRYFYRGGSNVVVGANINGTLRQSFTHDSLDRLSYSTVHTDGGELTTSYTYANNTTSGTATTQLKTAASPLESFSFESYESSGNLSGWRYSNQFWSSIFSASYDKLGQLTTAVWNDHPRTYEYDKHGNILKETVHPFGVGDTVEHNYVYSSDWVDQLISYDGKAITYDNIGNPLNYMGKTMTWDYGRRLMSVLDGSNMINFAYDLSGNRIAKNNIRYYYSADGLLVIPKHK